ncbi:DUF4870 domain-containing protein [Salsipaludibacter albus]|uniref:DUF4870 domain-containing protein n=1 Tax=Salsipaludibacter albus TaxID=2849650 RepID=UPI001EE3E19B|nr:DUF4870 domain-containing protein [Salsipaludibacter albus]
MSTCPNCGSEYADGASCVVCGHPGDDPSEVAEPSADTTDTRVEAAVTGADTAIPGAATGTTTAPPPPDAPAPPPSAPTGPGTALQPPSPDALPVTESERNWGMVAHLSSLVAAGIGGMGFLGPLIVWLVKKDDSRFVRHHAVEALNFNLSLLLYTLLMVMVGLTIVGLVVAIPAAVIGLVLWFVASIVAAVKAQRGEAYRYPLTIRLVRE